MSLLHPNKAIINQLARGENPDFTTCFELVDLVVIDGQSKPILLSPHDNIKIIFLHNDSEASFILKAEAAIKDLYDDQTLQFAWMNGLGAILNI